MKSDAPSLDRKNGFAEGEVPVCKAATFITVLLVLIFFVAQHYSLSHAQVEAAQTSPSPSASPSPSPSPSPTPVTGLHQWGAVTLFHGLPSDRVHAIAQDTDGSMWFGTEAGLAKFDGRRTLAITDPDLPGGRVLALQSDPDGSVWIGTETGASHFANGKFIAVKELAGKTINAIIAPDRGRAVMATEQGMIYECHFSFTNSEVEGVSRTEPVTSLNAKQLLASPLQSADTDRPGLLPITCLAIAHNKLLAGSLSRGVLEIENGNVRTVEMRPAAYFVRALETDANDHLWVGVKSKKEESGFYETSDKAALTRRDLSTGPVTALQTGTDGELWVGSDGRGVFNFKDPKNVVHFTFDGTLGGLRSDHVYAIFVDRESVVWFGTDRGVSRYDPNAPRVEPVGDNPESNFVRALYQGADGRSYCGTNRGLFTYDKTTSRWRPIESLAHSIIYAIGADRDGRTLIGSASGFFVAQRDSSSFDRLQTASGAVDAPGSVRAAAQFQSTTYIATFGRGVERIDGGRAKLVWPNGSSESAEALSLFADGDRQLLIGTTKGVALFDGQTGKTDPMFDSIKGATVRSIDGAGGLIWIGASSGVFICQNGNCTNAAPGFEARSVVVSHDSNLKEAWVATTGGGLLKILIDGTHGPILSRLDIEQGLPSQNVFAVVPHRDAEGHRALMIGTSRGVVRYTPGEVQPALQPTRIISKRVHQPEELRSGLALEYPQNSLLLDVTAMSSRTFPEQFQYAFLLTDSHGKVIRQKLSRDSQFTMEGLKPGKYRVTARAFTKDLISSNPLTFELNVAGAPFPWTSTALAVLLALALIALFWAIVERKRIVRTSAALADANRELAGARLDLANEAERERRRIARDLHDQTLADLRHLLLLTDQISANGGAKASPALRSEIESISQEVRRICEDLSPSALENVGLGAALQFALIHAMDQSPPDCKFKYEFRRDESLDEQLNLPASEQIQVYRIAQEALSNICRHAQAKHVSMSIDAENDGGFVLEIQDDGTGFDSKDAKDSSRGIANIRARASMIDAEAKWSRRESGGTAFTLTRKSGPI